MRLFIFSDEARKIFLKEVWNINIEEIGNRRARVFPHTVVVAESLLIVRFGEVVQSQRELRCLEITSPTIKLLERWRTLTAMLHECVWQIELIFGLALFQG